MPLGFEVQHAELFDRGGQVRIGPLEGVVRIQWRRVRDDKSYAKVNLTSPTPECVSSVLSKLEAARTELVIYRGSRRVWEGPVNRVAWKRNEIEIVANDIVEYVDKTVMRDGYDNTYPNVTSVLNRMSTILNGELQRKELINPPINVLPHVRTFPTPEDARTSRKTLPWEYTVFEHLEQLAWRGGLDYTALGRSLMLWDTHSEPFGRSQTVTAEDFLGDTIITSYGSQTVTFAAVTDGMGNVGTAGGTDPYYGLIEILDTAYDEEKDEGDPPTSDEMASQAERNMAGRLPTPTVVRVPDGSRVNPRSTALDLDHLVPGMWVPLRADLPGKTLTQMQKIDEVRVQYLPDEGESFAVTLSPAPNSPLRV